MWAHVCTCVCEFMYVCVHVCVHVCMNVVPVLVCVHTYECHCHMSCTCHVWCTCTIRTCVVCVRVLHTLVRVPGYIIIILHMCLWNWMAIFYSSSSKSAFLAAVACCVSSSFCTSIFSLSRNALFLKYSNRGMSPAAS